MKHWTTTFLFVLGLATILSAANGGYSIKVSIEGFSEKELYLGYYLGDKQYLRDTAVADGSGAYTFTGEETLPGGVYLIVLPPDNNFFQILITEQQQRFSLKTKKEDFNKTVTFTGSPENTAFYQYLAFLSDKTKQAEPIRTALEKAADEAEKKKLQQELDKLGKEVTDFQLKFVKDNPGSFAAAIIKANLNQDLPEFQGTEDEKMRQAWYYTRQHYFDNINLADPHMLRTPFLFERLDNYVHKLHVQHPDSIILAIDDVLARLRPAQESFRFYLVHFLNTYATSKFVGMDAVYVHLVEKYYAAGDASWLSDEQLKKITENARVLKPLLVGKIAPNITMQKRDGSKVSLQEVDAEYTILYFWRYDCGHCKENLPFIKSFYEKYKDKGVKIFAVCVKFRDEVNDCWKYIDENGIGDWLHTVDPYLQSNYYTIYNVKTTPQIYILDRKKEIISKGIGGEQLEEVMDRIIEMRKAEEK